MKAFTFALIAAASAMEEANESHFMEYLAKHNKHYSDTTEFQTRFIQYVKKHALIETMNHIQDTATYGHNEFSDWSEEEYNNLLGFKMPADHVDNEFLNGNAPMAPAPTAAEVNWVSQGHVTAVKNQQLCGSCWAFSSTGAMEGAYAQRYGLLQSFSEQQLVDCATPYGTLGCSGGWQDQAFTYAQHYYMLTEASYPYTGRQGACNFAGTPITYVTSFTSVQANSLNALKQAIARQPVAVTVDASGPFGSYTGGVVTYGCGTTLNHAVLAVGYGTENGTPYILVKNSWGAGWGVGGYIKLGQQEGAGICGVQMHAVYPTVA